MENFTIISKNTNINESEFSFFTYYSNKYLLSHFCEDRKSILCQLNRDFHRTNIYIEESKAKYLRDVFYYTTKHPYLKINETLVYLMMTQIIFTFPLKIIIEIISNINKELIPTEDKDGRIIIVIDSHTISVQKKLSASIPNSITGEIEKKMEFKISFDMDLSIEETLLHIESYDTSGSSECLPTSGITRTV